MTREAIEEQAALWFAELCDPACSEKRRLACEHWQQQDPQHAQAFQKLQVLWQASAALPLSAPPRQKPRTISRRALLGGFATASLAASGGFWLWQQQGLLQTTSGQTLSLTLPDGSLLQLAAASAVRLYQDSTPLRLELQCGELFLQAQSRVQLGAQGGRCTLEQGSSAALALEQGSAFFTLVSGVADFVLGGTQLRLESGQRIGWRGAQLLGMQQVDAQQVLAWREGRLVFFDTPLAAVLEQIERWQGGSLWLLSPKLAQRKVSLLFDLKRDESALDLLQSALPIRVRRIGPLVLIHAR